MPDIKLRIIRATGEIEGVTRPNTQVRVTNKSVMPLAPGKVDGFETVVRSDAQGKFSASVPAAAEGDKVRVQAGGKKGTWLNVQLEGISSRDTRRPVVSLQGYRLVMTPDGRADFECLRRQRAVGEPGATVRFYNQRNRHKTDFVLDANGCLPKAASLPAKPGDTFKVKISDGTYNPSLRLNGGKISVLPVAGFSAIDDPAPTSDVDPDTAKLRRHRGPLVRAGIDLDDPMQGGVGNCWLVATVAGIAEAMPDRIADMIEDHGDGRFTVTLKRFDHQKKSYVDEKVTVDTDLYRDGSGPVYGAARNASSARRMELWWPVVEKAYAKWKGSYDAIEWGWGHEAYEALLGAEAEHLDFGTQDESATFERLAAAAADNRPSLAISSPKNARRLEREGVVADHAYTLVDCYEKDGERFVTLRNPWGSFEPDGDGRDDGVFTLGWEAFSEFFVAAVVGPS